MRLNLARFFRLTGVALVLVAAGLVMSAVHTAHEAGWLNSLQGRAFDLSFLVRPGTVTSSLLTGVLGLQPQPTVGEAAGWLLYALPMLAIVLWPNRLRRWNPIRGRQTTGIGAVCLAMLLLLFASGCGDSKKASGRTVNVTRSDSGSGGAAATVDPELVTDALGGYRSYVEAQAAALH